MRGSQSKPSLQQPQTSSPAVSAGHRKAPSLGFGPLEDAFFAAQLPARERASEVQATPRRRPALRVLVTLVVGAAALLAWHGPGKLIAPRALSHLYVASEVQGHALGRAAAALSPPARQHPTANAPAPRTRPATATRPRARQR